MGGGGGGGGETKELVTKDWGHVSPGLVSGSGGSFGPCYHC